MIELDIHPLDDSHTVSIDEAVVMLLGLGSVIRICTDQDDGHCFGSLREAMHDIQEAVLVEQESADAELSEYTSGDDPDEATLEELQKAVSNINDDVKAWYDLNDLAGQYSRKLKAAVFDTKSKLVTDKYESGFYRSPRIVKNSLHDWAKKILDVDLNEVQKPGFKSGQATHAVEQVKYKSDKVTVYVLSQLLAEAIQYIWISNPDLASKKDSGYMESMFSAEGNFVSSKLIRYIKNKIGPTHNFSSSTVRRRLKEALDAVADGNIDPKGIEEIGYFILNASNLSEKEKAALVPKSFPKKDT